jgi:hypothetical protein
MTNLTPHSAVHASPLARAGWSAVLAAACALAFAASPARAQQAPPSSPPPPPPPAKVDAPLVLVPPSAPPPPAPSAARGPSAQRALTVAAIRAPASGSALPPDSVRPRAPAARLAPTADAVALCSDGAFIVAPGDSTGCASHRGVRVMLQRRAEPPPKASAANTASAANVRALAAQRSVQLAPPADATMQCKDGTYLTGPPAAGRCAARGGVAALFPVAAKPVPVAPRRP